MNSSANSKPLVISGGDYVATLSQTGAALIQLSYRGEQFCPERSEETLVSSYHGSVIAPWPNRIRDGKYRFDGKEYSLPINETARANALHGFSANKRWELEEKASDSAVFRLELEPTEGYPWSLSLRAQYLVSGEGLRLLFSAAGSKHQPFGWAFHPHLTLPDTKPDSWNLTHSANSVMLVDSARLLPVALAKVEDADFDFRSGTSPEIPGLDHAFTDLMFDSQGFTSVQLESERHRIDMSFDTNSPWLQLHYPNPLLTSVPSLVVEPMSLEPDAFNSRREQDLLLQDGFAAELRIQITQK